LKFTLNTATETELFGAKLWQALPKQGVIFLHGELGAGKTTLVRGLLTAAGHQGAVKSPTYTIVEEYTLAQQKIFHFDLYRISDPEELELIGIRDYINSDSLCFIEWAELGTDYLPTADLSIHLEYQAQARSITLSIANTKPNYLNNFCWQNHSVTL